MKKRKNAIKIALFNHKGGVSKTTTAFNLGWMLAEKGKRVLLVDGDPQCNLTGIVLGYKRTIELEKFYRKDTNNNIRAGLSPAFESKPQLIQPVECIEVDGSPRLYLLPGHIRFAEYDVTLGVAQDLASSFQPLQNVPGAISFLLDKTAKAINADLILIDMSPSLSSINQNFLMISDFFVVPCSPDYFSVMAIDSLTTILPKWHSWSQGAQKLPILQEATYPYPIVTPKFLGTIIQKYRLRSGRPAKAFRRWIAEIDGLVESKLVPALTKIGMTLSKKIYKRAGLTDNHCLQLISDFNTLIAKSQQVQTPVFALTESQLQQGGEILKNTIIARDNFKHLFEALADKVLALTTNE